MGDATEEAISSGRRMFFFGQAQDVHLFPGGLAGTLTARALTTAFGRKNDSLRRMHDTHKTTISGLRVQQGKVRRSNEILY